MRRIKSHTLNKLLYFRKYLEAYLVATKTLSNKYYIDAFAGTGKSILCDESCESSGGARCIKCKKGKEVDGSVSIALKAKNAFNCYTLIELNKRNLETLKNRIKNEVDPERIKRVDFKEGDCNKLLPGICKSIPEKTGCLVFLDPEGSELFWETIKSLSFIKKVDVLIMYPYDMALVRLTRHYKKKLDKFYGTPDWRDIYFSKTSVQKKKRDLLNFYIENLKKIGFEYIVYKQIKRRLREGKPLYHFILATHHPVGEKIMSYIFDKELDGQQKMKLFES